MKINKLNLFLVFVLFALTSNLTLAQRSMIFEMIQDCRSIAPFYHSTADGVIFNKQCVSNDCNAIVNQDERLCETADCHALIHRERERCESTDCKAVLLKDVSLCDTDNCRAIIAADANRCAYTTHGSCCINEDGTPFCSCKCTRAQKCYSIAGSVLLLALGSAGTAVYLSTCGGCI